MISNKNEISKSDFDLFVKSHNLEVYNEEQFNGFMSQGVELIQKSEFEDLSEEQLENLEIWKAEVASFDKLIVTNWDEDLKQIVKSVYFTRQQQIKWDEQGDDDLLKSKSGIYLDTFLNRELNRVGKEYNSSMFE